MAQGMLDAAQKADDDYDGSKAVNEDAHSASFTKECMGQRIAQKTLHRGTIVVHECK